MSRLPAIFDSLRHLLLAVAFAAFLLNGCALQPLRPDTAELALVAIQQAFERTVVAAHNDPKIDWQSGWIGNARINILGGTRRRGLCYEWRNLVYAGVLPTVRRVGWEATGVVISKNTYSEHSAVVVFDPKRIRLDRVLSAAPGQRVYVLDAWRRGRADIYPMHAWLRLPLIVRSPPQLKTLPVGSGINSAGGKPRTNPPSP
ncbi:MAG: hypothetical protein ACREVK_04520 [Gammaproteobacteria bacterium]